MNEEHTAESDCGLTYGHDPHLWRTQRGKIKACDGSTTKRTRVTSPGTGGCVCPPGSPLHFDRCPLPPGSGRA